MVDIQDLKISKHFYERYTERVKKITDKNQSKQYIQQNKSIIDEWIAKTVKHAKLIYTGILNQRQRRTTNFYISGDYVLIQDQKNEKFVTVYECDFGYEEINKAIRKGLLKKLEDERQKNTLSESEIGVELENLNTEIENQKIAIEMLQQELKQRQMVLEDTIEYKKTLSKRSHLNQSKMREIIQKLCNPREYSRDIQILS